MTSWHQARKDPVAIYTPRTLKSPLALLLDQIPAYPHPLGRAFWSWLSPLALSPNQRFDSAQDPSLARHVRPLGHA